MNKMIFISSVLDPRNKLDYVPFAIVDINPQKALHMYHLHPTLSNNSSSISSVSGCDNFVNRKNENRNNNLRSIKKLVEVRLAFSEPFPINIEKDLEYLEQLELLQLVSSTIKLRGNGSFVLRVLFSRKLRIAMCASWQPGL
ncbi:hypothetical protein H5410_044864 [Solanum commersonii]|uniref:Uncharacterized protein n=1 Tax=Solanum commersonii TaxID=4109 RepID=A0A9J5XAX5_SOLCO|nr:hypothetical protein H5410_044864 [Solanum commersonii]